MDQASRRALDVCPVSNVYYCNSFFNAKIVDMVKSSKRTFVFIYNFLNYVITIWLITNLFIIIYCTSKNKNTKEIINMQKVYEYKKKYKQI